MIYKKNHKKVQRDFGRDGRWGPMICSRDWMTEIKIETVGCADEIQKKKSNTNPIIRETQKSTIEANLGDINSDHNFCAMKYFNHFIKQV